MKSSQQKNMLSTFVLPLSLTCLFAFTALMLTFMGTESYKAIRKHYSENNDGIVAVSYFTTRLRQNNEIGALKLRHDAAGDRLIIMSTSGDKQYETAIFCRDGGLYESYTISEHGPVGAEDDFKIMDLKKLSVTRLSDRLLQITLIMPSGEEKQFNMGVVAITEEGAAQ